MKKTKTSKLALQAITTVFLLISTINAIPLGNLTKSIDFYEGGNRSEPIRKNGIIVCHLGVFIPPADIVPLRTNVEIRSIDGSIHRYIPAGIVLTGLKIISFLPTDKEYIISAQWQGQIRMEHVHSFNQLGITRVFLIFQVDGP